MQSSWPVMTRPARTSAHSHSEPEAILGLSPGPAPTCGPRSPARSGTSCPSSRSSCGETARRSSRRQRPVRPPVPEKDRPTASPAPRTRVRPPRTRRRIRRAPPDQAVRRLPAGRIVDQPPVLAVELVAGGIDPTTSPPPGPSSSSRAMSRSLPRARRTPITRLWRPGPRPCTRGAGARVFVLVVERLPVIVGLQHQGVVPADEGRPSPAAGPSARWRLNRACKPVVPSGRLDSTDGPKSKTSISCQRHASANRSPTRAASAACSRGAAWSSESWSIDHPPSPPAVCPRLEPEVKRRLPREPRPWQDRLHALTKCPVALVRRRDAGLMSSLRAPGSRR